MCVRKRNLGSYSGMTNSYISRTACVPIGQCSVRTPIIAARLGLLSASSWADFLRITLGQKDLAVAQVVVVNQRLPSSLEDHRPSART